MIGTAAMLAMLDDATAAGDMAELEQHSKLAHVFHERLKREARAAAGGDQRPEMEVSRSA
jgi:hypothetical protein